MVRAGFCHFEASMLGQFGARVKMMPGGHKLCCLTLGLLASSTVREGDHTMGGMGGLSTRRHGIWRLPITLNVSYHQCYAVGLCQDRPIGLYAFVSFRCVCIAGMDLGSSLMIEAIYRGIVSRQVAAILLP